MLTEKRHEYILQELKRKGSITVNEIKEELGISESTIRRDLNSLDEEGKLVKVFGGAVSADFEVSGSEPSVTQKREINIDGKKLIAKYAAGLIIPDIILGMFPHKFNPAFHTVVLDFQNLCIPIHQI